MIDFTHKESGEKNKLLLSHLYVIIFTNDFF
jgi:hypothetical protein